MLLESRASLFMLVDVQERLMPAMHEPTPVIAHCAILIGSAFRLGVPVVATEQNPQKLGPTIPQLAGLLRGGGRRRKHAAEAVVEGANRRRAAITVR